MFTYHKINTVFKRDEKTKKIILKSWSQPEFEFLANNTWEWTEKIDGTNCRVFWNHETKTIQFGGRTENAQIPAALIARLQEIFTVEKLVLLYPDVSVMFFGEGYGAKIQAIGSYYKSDGVDFILFDVVIGRWWLQREAVNKIAVNLDIQSVPIVGEGSLGNAIDYVQDNNNSNFGKFTMEGIVLRPAVELFARNGSRIIAKLKHKDFL
jgi:hypothetical protein